MPITPDTKDWTWVTASACAECGADPQQWAPASYGERLRAAAAAWQEVLAGAGSGAADLRRRPDDSTWSVLEYSCHVRDVVRLYDSRLQRMLTEDDPLYANWDQDATAVEERYAEQDPAVVAAELATAAELLAARFDGVADWERPGRRSDGASFTVETFGRYFLHDVVHHLHDVGSPVSP
jgi:hypothetical protein